MFVYWHVCVHALVRACVQTPKYVCLSVHLSDCMCVCVCVCVCLSVCLSVGLHVSMYVYMCVCQNEGLIGTLCACCETYQTILAPESWKSVNVQKVSQTDQMVLGGS